MSQFRKKEFLSIPIDAKDEKGKPVTPFTVKISAIIDHAGTSLDPKITDPHAWGLRAKDQKVVAFNEEVGDEQASARAPFGYAAAKPHAFFGKHEINYVGATEVGDALLPTFYLNYDGHSGYDFSYPAGTPILAAADGLLQKSASDPINGADGAATPWDGFHTFYIDHGEGWQTWYLHAEELAPEITATLAMTSSVAVTRSQMIGQVGSFGAAGAHLHFEVRQNGRIVDPYKDRLWM